MLKRYFSVCALVCAFGAAHANLLVNGNIDTDFYAPNTAPQLSSLTGWNIDPVGNVAGIGVGYLSSPTQMIDLSGYYDQPNTGSQGSGINQTISDVVGQQYTVTFVTYIPYSGAIGLYLNNNLVLNNLGNGNNSYQFKGTGSDNLNFISDYGNTTHLGSVDVVATPEPSTALIPAAALGLALFRRRRA